MVHPLSDALNYSRKVLPSKNPPAGLKPAEVPLFVAFSSDDNGKSGAAGSGTNGGLTFLLDLMASKTNPAGRGNPRTFDGTPTLASLYNAGFYAVRGQWENPVYTKKTWRKAVEAGHEVGNHTFNHFNGNKENFTPAQWEAEIRLCNDYLTRPWSAAEAPDKLDEAVGPGVKAADIVGFRTPFLGYNDNVFKALKAAGFAYDCSIMEGHEPDQDGTDSFWPFTLDEGSPSDKVTAADHGRAPVGSHPGLWELPTYAILLPPDELCARYGVPAGFRAKMKRLHPYFDEAGGKIPGLDWTLWSEYEMSRAEFVAAFRYTFDQKRQGNRSPMIFCIHSDIYAEDYDDPMPNATAQDRREALKDCYDYVLTFPETRVTTMKDILAWMLNPAAL